MRAARIADGDMRTDRAGNPFRAGHQRQHQPHAAQTRPDAHCLRRIGVGNPHVDVDLVVEIIGQGDEFNFRGKIAEQLRRQNGWVSDSQHGFAPDSHATRKGVFCAVKDWPGR